MLFYPSCPNSCQSKDRKTDHTDCSKGEKKGRKWWTDVAVRLWTRLHESFINQTKFFAERWCSAYFLHEILEATSKATPRWKELFQKNNLGEKEAASAKGMHGLPSGQEQAQKKSWHHTQVEAPFSLSRLKECNEKWPVWFALNERRVRAPGEQWKWVFFRAPFFLQELTVTHHRTMTENNEGSRGNGGTRGCTQTERATRDVIFVRVTVVCYRPTLTGCPHQGNLWGKQWSRRELRTREHAEVRERREAETRWEITRNRETSVRKRARAIEEIRQGRTR